MNHRRRLGAEKFPLKFEVLWSYYEGVARDELGDKRRGEGKRGGEEPESEEEGWDVV